MLTLNDGRKKLYQWDVGRMATVNVECDTVHFSNLKYGNSLPVEVKDGKVAIPNQLLLSGAPLYCWAFATDNDGEYTKKEQTIDVIKRAKPSDYVYMETEIINIQNAVENALQEAKESGDFKGEKGDRGEKGDKGDTGVAGKDGLDGVNGVDGLTPYIGKNLNWWIGDEDTGVKALGEQASYDVLAYLKSKHVFYYYSDIKSAITDMHNNVHEHCQLNQDDSTNCATYYDDKAQRWVLVLLKDITVPLVATEFTIPVEINYAGHYLTFPDVGLYYWRFKDETYLNGTLGGGARGTNVSEPSKNTMMMIFDGKDNTISKVVIDGGEYSVTGATASKMSMRVLVTQYVEKLEVRNATINCELDGAAKQVVAFYANHGGSAVFDNIKMQVSCTNTSQTIIIAALQTYDITKSVDIMNCEVAVEPKANSVNAYGMNYYASPIVTLTDNYVYTDAADDSVDGVVAEALNIVNSVGKVFIYGGTYIGTHSAINTGAPVFVKGGKFVSCSHGGFYFAHENKSSYIQDAIVGCEAYSGNFDQSYMGNPKPLGAFYISSNGNGYDENIHVYMDNCTIAYTEDTLHPNGVLRGTGNSKGHHLHVSNMQFVPDKYMRADADGDYVYIGMNNNVDPLIAGKGYTRTYELNSRYRYEDSYVNHLVGPLSHTSEERDRMTPNTGMCIFDTNLKKPVWWNGTAWVDAMGANV